jgi:predicted nucleic acid-binding protein
MRVVLDANIPVFALMKPGGREALAPLLEIHQEFVASLRRGIDLVYLT